MKNLMYVVKMVQPWQVILQTVDQGENGFRIVNNLVYSADERPSYNDVVAKLMDASRQM